MDFAFWHQWQTHDTDVLRDPREYDWFDEP